MPVRGDEIELLNRVVLDPGEDKMRSYQRARYGSERLERLHIAVDLHARRWDGAEGTVFEPQLAVGSENQHGLSIKFFEGSHIGVDFYAGGRDGAERAMCEP